jgi:hypothetical protein
MSHRDQVIQQMLCRYVGALLKPIAGNFGVLDKALGRSVTEQIVVTLFKAKLQLEGVPMNEIPDSAITTAVRMAMWPPADLPFECAKLIGDRGGDAVRDLLKAQCGTRRRARLPDGPRRAEMGGRHG